jgi:hypothetical protein
MRDNPRRVDPFASSGVELLFILLPFLVYGIIFTINNTPANLLQLPEWSFATSILFGQTIVKFVSTITSKRFTTKSERVALIVALLLVLGVVPSLVVLIFMVTAASPSDGLMVAQITLFIVAVCIFLFFRIDLAGDEDT